MKFINSILSIFGVQMVLISINPPTYKIVKSDWLEGVDLDNKFWGNNILQNI